MPSGTYIRTQEIKDKIRLAHLGQKAWNKGLTKETDVRLKAISESRTGKNNPNWKENKKIYVKKGYNPWNKNKKCPQISQRLKGNIPWNKGIECTEETKKKLSKALTGRIISQKSIDKMIETKKNNGYITTPETRKKISKSKKGEKSHFWKGGISKKNDVIRKSIEYRLWRESVFARDNWTCQKTKIKGGKLHPHHIKNFAQYPELRFAIDNGITLSEESHKEFHKIYGTKNNNKEQLIEYFKKD